MIGMMNTGDSPLIYRNLMAVGLLGIVYRSAEDADIVNNVIDSTLKQPLQYQVCRAIASGMTGDGSYAKQVLGEHIAMNPDDESARLAMAVALTLAGDDDGFNALQSVLATTTDMDIRTAANNMLTFMSRYQ